MRTDLRRPAGLGRGVGLAGTPFLAALATVVFGAAQPPATVSGDPTWDQPWFPFTLGLAIVVVLAICVLAVARRGLGEARAHTWAHGKDPPDHFRRALPERWTSAVISTPGPGIRHASGQFVGKRERQEDDLGHINGDTLDLEGNHSVALVADGMGGHAAGEVASRAAVRSFLQAYGTRGLVRDRLQSALDRANAAIAEEADRNAALVGMGTTLVAAAVTEQGLHWISVGDSPLYLFRAGRLERLNEDHSMRPVIARLVEEDPEAASNYSPNQLLSALMGGPIEKVDAPTTPRRLEAGDIVVVASDGLETLDEEETGALIAKHRGEGPGAVCDALLRTVEAKDHPRQDNTSLFVIEVDRSSVNGGPSENPTEAAAEPATEPQGDEADGRSAEPRPDGQAGRDDGGGDARNT